MLVQNAPHKGVSQRSKCTTKAQQQRLEFFGGVFVPCILHACQVRATVGDSSLCCFACVMSFEC